MKDEPRTQTRHKLDHAVPTVIHDPEAGMPVLARWIYRAMENRVQFWGIVAAVVVGVIALTVLANGVSFRGAGSDEAWTRLETAKTAAERLDIAKEYPNTPAERWALLQAATEFYDKGFADLPNNRDVALPELKHALTTFQQAFEKSEKDSPQARAAALGIARTHEARNELDKAAEQYEYVAKTWPGSDEAKQSERLAARLRKPESAAFYKELYAYKPIEVTIPPAGKSALDLPAGHPPIGGDSPLAPFMIPPPPAPTASSGAPAAKESSELPKDVFTPPSGPKSEVPVLAPPPAPKSEAAKADTSAPIPPPTPKSEAPKP